MTSGKVFEFEFRIFSPDCGETATMALEVLAEVVEEHASPFARITSVQLVTEHARIELLNNPLFLLKDLGTLAKHAFYRAHPQWEEDAVASAGWHWRAKRDDPSFGGEWRRE